MKRFYLGLGSNLGDRLATLVAARAALLPLVRLTAASPIYETTPWGVTDQPLFLNQVVRGLTELSPLELLDYLKGIETVLGRQPSYRYGPRLIDLDILLYDNLVVQTPELVIPHPRLAERAFVLVPLADLAPNLRHPISSLTVRQLLNAVDKEGITLFHQ
jgi:2-amino-4-hydroxy-6-hydroxymethyldihydropteridine diphosphokinase